MSIVQDFYDNLASHYDKLFLDWEETTREQAIILDKIFTDMGFDKSARVLDCACGTGTQSIGLASLGYNIAASDISEGALREAKKNAEKNNVSIFFKRADFCSLEESVSAVEVVCVDNSKWFL